MQDCRGNVQLPRDNQHCLQVTSVARGNALRSMTDHTCFFQTDWGKEVHCTAVQTRLYLAFWLIGGLFSLPLEADAPKSIAVFIAAYTVQIVQCSAVQSSIVQVRQNCT